MSRGPALDETERRERQQAARRSLSKSKTVAFSFSLLAFSTAVVVAGGEGLARLKGFKPWTPHQAPTLRVEPGGALGATDPALGHRYLPGRFVVTLADGYSFRVTHLENTLRITRPLSAYGQPRPLGQVWIFGCSFTHGWALNDEETYPWLIQEQLPAHDVVNFGVGGYGTLHSLIQFREALRKGPPPRIAVLSYASFHDTRNTLNRDRLKALVPGVPKGHLALVPSGRIGPDGGLETFMADADYRAWPLQRHLAFVHLLEERFNRREQVRVESHRISRSIVAEFRKLADQRGARLVVAGIFRDRDTKAMLDHAASEGMESVDISVLNVAQFKSLPHDRHPNARANRRFAARLAAQLRRD